MIKKTLAALALGSALTVCIPASIYAADRDAHRSEERRDDHGRRERSDHERDDRDRHFQTRYRYRGDGDWDDYYWNAGRLRAYPNPALYANGYFDQYGNWYPYPWVPYPWVR